MDEVGDWGSGMAIATGTAASMGCSMNGLSLSSMSVGGGDAPAPFIDMTGIVAGCVLEW